MWKEDLFFREDKATTTFFTLQIRANKQKPTQKHLFWSFCTRGGTHKQRTVSVALKCPETPNYLQIGLWQQTSNNCNRLCCESEMYKNSFCSSYLIVNNSSVWAWQLFCVCDVWKSTLAALAHYICLLFLKDFRIFCSWHWKTATSLMGYVPPIVLSETVYFIGCKARQGVPVLNSQYEWS